MRIYQVYELLAKTHRVGVVVVSVGGVVVMKMQLGVTSTHNASQLGYTLETKSHLKKEENLQKVTMGMK